MKIAATAASLVFGLAAVTQAATSFDAATDFSTSSNPNGVWSYGSYANIADQTTFVPFTTEGDGGTVVNPTYTGLALWFTPSGTHNPDPNVIKNLSGHVVDDGTNHWPVNALTLGPAFGGSVIRFTVPVAGTYDITASFQNTQFNNANTNPDLHVYISGLGDLLGAPSSDSANDFNTLAVLSVGQTVDFAADGGTKTILTSASLNLLPVPEPSSLAAISVIGLAAIRRRK